MGIKGALIRDMDDADASAAIVEELEQPFRELVFSGWDAAFLETPEGRVGIHTALVDRYLASRRHAVAWLDDAVGLAGRHVVEVGCGTGASTVALAEFGASVWAIDIDQPSVAAAEHRVKAHQVDGVTFETCEAAEILNRALARKADLYVMFAVLEHLTESERHETLSALWNALEPGGAIAIIETPNRLSYNDSHSAVQDFVHLLPDELAFRLKDTSPRQAYRDVMGHAIAAPTAEAAHEVRIRFGLGASYHGFLAAIDEPLDEIVVADGYEDTIMSWFGTNVEEVTLLRYMLERQVDVPMAFARPVMNVILQKPTGPEDRKIASQRNAERRSELAARYQQPADDAQRQVFDLREAVARQERELASLRQGAAAEPAVTPLAQRIRRIARESVRRPKSLLRRLRRTA